MFTWVVSSFLAVKAMFSALKKRGAIVGYSTTELHFFLGCVCFYSFAGGIATVCLLPPYRYLQSPSLCMGNSTKGA
jgi:hypothetical protein